MITKIEKNLFNTYIYILVTLILFFIFINGSDLILNIFGGRDLVRSNDLLNSFEVYGAEFGMQKGRRVPGGFNYYYLYLLTRVTKDVYVLNCISIIFTTLSFLYLLKTYYKWIGIHGLLFSLIFFLSSDTFSSQINKFWNPSLGFPFAILALAFFFKFIDKQKTIHLLFAFIFVFLSSQFHISYSVLAFTFLIITLFKRFINIPKLFFILLLSITFSYSPLIINSFILLINESSNDYSLINSIKFEGKEEINLFIWFINKIYIKSILITKILFQKKILLVISIFLALLISIIIFNKKILNHIYKFNNYFNESILILFFLIIIIFNNQFTTNQLIFYLTVIIFGFIGNYLLKKKSNILDFSNEGVILYKSLFLLFFLIVIISSITYIFTYGMFLISVGDPTRYTLSILPIYSLILGYSVSIIYLWLIKSNKYLSKFCGFLILIVFTIKIGFYYYNEIHLPKKDKINSYSLSINIINNLVKNFKLNKNDLFTKVVIKSKPAFDLHFYIENNFNNDQISKYNKCLLVLIKNKNYVHQFFDVNNIEKNIDFFGSEIIILNTFDQDKYKIIEYKPIYGDCLKGLYNDYIITDKEKKIHNFLINKQENTFYLNTLENKKEYYLKITDKNIEYPIDLLFEIHNKDYFLDITLFSKRLRNSNTALNGYWDEISLLKPKLLFIDNLTGQENTIFLTKGILGNDNLKTPWLISNIEMPKGNYTLWFKADTLKESISNKNIENFKYLIDSNYIRE